MQIKSSFLKKMFPIFVLQFISAVILVVTVLIIKYFSKGTFIELKSLHNEYFESETSLKEVVLSEVNLNIKEPLAVNVMSDNEVISVNNKMTLPLSEGVLSSSFGYRSDPFTSKTKMHKGIDIAAETGTYIYAVADGVVSVVGFDEFGFGNYLSIKHTEKVKSIYGHCSEILVSDGDLITKGQPIAKVGNSGASTGSHLHFEIRIDEISVNPQWYINFGD